MVNRSCLVWDSYMRFTTTELPIFLEGIEVATNVKVVAGSRCPGRNLASNIEIWVCPSTYADLRRTWCLRLCLVDWLQIGKTAVVMILCYIGTCNMICHDINSNVLSLMVNDNYWPIVPCTVTVRWRPLWIPRENSWISDMTTILWFLIYNWTIIILSGDSSYSIHKLKNSGSTFDLFQKNQNWGNRIEV